MSTTDGVPSDAILHKKVRQFLKAKAIKDLMRRALTDEQRKVLQLCVVEAEYHEVLDRGHRPCKKKFFRMISESYNWVNSTRPKRGRPRKDV